MVGLVEVETLDGPLNVFKVGNEGSYRALGNLADDMHADVMLHCIGFGVMDTRFRIKSVSCSLGRHLDRKSSEVLVVFRGAVTGVYDRMLIWVKSGFVESPMPICENRSLGKAC